MRYLINTLTLFIGLLIGPTLQAATLKAEVDRERIPSNESLRLIVELDKTASKTIDFSELELQFDIVNTQRSNQTSIINGKVDAKTQWILILIPKETGDLLIPSFEYEGIYSQAIPITVIESNKTDDKIKNNDVFLDIAVNKNTLYVQEQLLLTLRLYYKVPLASYDDETLAIDNTSIALVAENNLRTNLNGESYSVLEKIYALHPQASGQLRIPVQSWRLEKALNRFNFGRSGTPYLYVRSEALEIDVLPINSASTANTWLPSTAVTLDAKWQDSSTNNTENTEARVGEPINLKLITIANGLTAAQLPDIEVANSDNFTVYSDQADIDDNKSRIGIIGTRINNFAIIPQKTGSLTFPAIELTWWNIEKNKEEIARIPEKTILVTEALQTTTSDFALPNIDSQPSSSAARPTLLFWQVLSAILLITLFVLAYFYKRQQRLLIYKHDNGNNTAPSELSAKQLIKRIEEAKQAGDLQKIRELVILYIASLFPQQQLTTLSEAAELVPSLKNELKELDQNLYGKTTANKNIINTLTEKLFLLKKNNSIKSKKEYLQPFKRL